MKILVLTGWINEIRVEAVKTAAGEKQQRQQGEGTDENQKPR